MTIDPDELLAEIRGERGYALSYHEILARTDAEFLTAYRRFYRSFTLDPRHLDARRRELIWAGLLAQIEEYVGSLHLERALAAGVTHAELRAAIRLGAVVASWKAISFAHTHWARLLGDGPDGAAEYRLVVDGARGPLTEVEADLILVNVAGARMDRDQFLHHLARLIAADVPEREIIEAISYLMVPMGANIFLWATDTWFEAVEEGLLPKGEVLSQVSFDTRKT